MQNAELFLSLAEIAGVFVGFGALIAVRSGAAMAVNEFNNIRWVVTIATWVVVAALAPVVVGSYGVAADELWLACGVLALALLAIVLVVYGRTPENRAELSYALTSQSRAQMFLWGAATVWLPAATLVVALLLVMFGALPDREQALYLTAVAMGLLMGALGLLGTLFEQRRAAASDDRGASPSTASPRHTGDRAG